MSCAAKTPSIAESHIEANTPEADNFRPFLIRDLTAYLEPLYGNQLTVDYELLRDIPTQSGVAYPKFYLWLKVTDADQKVIEGAARVAAVDKRRFDVTDFVPRSDIVSQPDILRYIFPQALIMKIQKKAGIQK